MKKNKKKNGGDFTISRRGLDKEIRKKRKMLPKLYQLTRTKKGYEENFQNAFKILMSFDVQGVDELLDGLELLIRRRRLKDLNAVFDSRYRPWLKTNRKRKRK